MLVKRLTLGMCVDRAEHELIAIRRSFGAPRRTGHPAGAADILHYDLLTEHLAHPSCDDTTEHIVSRNLSLMPKPDAIWLCGCRFGDASWLRAPNYRIGVNVTHVPYRGTGPAMQDLEGGRIDYLCEIITTAKPQIDGGTVKGLAILDSKRSPALPNLPTAAEQGTENLIAYTWNAIFLPKGAPEPIVNILHDAALEAMHTPLVRDRLQSLGAQIVTDNEATPQYLASFVRSEIDKWAAPRW
jgi:hypothetical protein